LERMHAHRRLISLRRATRALVTCLGLLIGAGEPAQAQQPDLPVDRPLALQAGEALVYDVRFGFLNVGTARMNVIGIETVRGRPAWHTRLEIVGGVPGYAVRDVLESWVDVATGNSLRFWQQSVEGSRQRERRYEIEPERGIYQQDGRPESPTVAQPLDEGAFMYFLRSQSLDPGVTYSYPRYFVPDRNPVTVTVVRQERIVVPAGRFDTVVLKPVIKSAGVFAENGRAEIWLTNDERRWMVQMVTHLKFGTLSLRLRQPQA
ncbi:MAG TPA: DUF3108 domain-containing protein, partial [Steroidobacteraceae bacterium]